MILRLSIICIAVVLALVAPALADSTAKVHGEVYSSDTFEPLDNAVVDVNSTPTQSMVAKYGLYSFELMPGNYTITARYYQNGTLTYSAEEIAKIKDNGTYVLDLLLLPVYSEELMASSKINGPSKNSTSNIENPATETVIDKINNSSEVNITEKSGFSSSTINYLLIAIMLFLLLAVGYRLSRKHKKLEKNMLQEEKTEHMTEDFSRLVNTSEVSVKVPDKSIYPEVRPNFQEDTEETVSLSEPVTELESKIPERKTSAESKEEYPVQEAELPPHEKDLADLGQEEENQKTPLEETTVNPEIDTSAPKKKFPLPADLEEVMNIIRGHGGRITQKDLRSRLKSSEGKVSLMLADLERREIIEKFKQGRGNVVILKDEER
jgi:uncharacterized membrane protein